MRGWREDLAAALPGWVAARVVVAGAWLANLALVAFRFDGRQPIPTDQGLWAWDGAYYRSLAEFGYAGVEFDGIRFHPLVPLLGVNDWGVLVLANVTGLLAGALVHRLVVVVCEDRDLARRSATLVALAPPAFSLVWAYAEGPFLVLSALHLLALHRRRWWAAAALGVLASLTRPTGLLLAVPAAVAAWQAWRTGRKEPVGWVAAILGPVAGIVGYLWWVERATGDWQLPLRIQEDLRDGFVLPPVRLVQGLGEMVTEPLGDGLHIPFALGLVALAWVAWQRLPPAWAALAAVAVLNALAAGNLNSIERYAYGAVPLIVAMAAVSGGRWWRPAVVLSSVAMAGMTVLAWQAELVP